MVSESMGTIASSPPPHQGDLMALGDGFDLPPGQAVMTKHYAAQLCLNQSQNPFVRLFHHSPDPMAVTTFPEGRHLLVNASYARWLGHPVSEILGQRPTDLGVVHDRRQFAQLRQQIRDRGSIQNIEIDSYFADGQTRTLLVSAELTQLDGQTCLLSVGKDITERKAIQATLTAAEARFRAIFEQMGVGVCQASLDGQLTDANPGMCRLLGYRRADLVGKTFIEITHPDDLGLDLQHYNRLLAGDLDSFTIEKRYCHRDGSHVWVALTVCLVRDDQGEPLFSIGVSQDISDRKQEEAERQAAELALQASHRRIHNILESITDAFFALDQQWRFTYLNQRAEQVLQRSRQRLLGQNLWHEIPEALGTSFSKDLRRAMAERVSLTVEDYMAHADSWCEFHVYPTPEGLAVYFQDVSDRKLIEDRLAYEAFHDSLTGSPNRAFFMDQLTAAALAAQASTEVAFAVLFIDLDRFKVINDSLGHLVGDQLLVECAQRLGSVVREGDLVARLGGDEFAILLRTIATIDEALVVADRIHEVLQTPLLLAGREIFVSASVGLASTLTGAVEAVDFLRDADTAMYQAKAQGRGQSVLFDPAMHEQVSTRLTLENDLQRAIARQELTLHYQPIVDLATHQLIGFEALVRWHHPRWGLISPAQFIPLAEETGLILAIGVWTQMAACQQLQAWRQRHPQAADLVISVNLSVKQFANPHLIDTIDAALAATGLSSDRLRLEITESALIDNPKTAESMLKALRERGIQLGIDDFGTGYSSLSMVHQFPMQMLKIDRSFIHSMATDPRGVAMVQAILALAQTLGMTAIAEGVETASQLHQLQQLGCPYAQGYHFAKPLPADQAEHLMLHWPQGAGKG